MGVTNCVCSIASYQAEWYFRRDYLLRRTLQAEHKGLLEAQAQTEQLLLNILPGSIAARLKQERQLIADDFAEVTILFGDIVNFTSLSSQISPTELVDLLNQIISDFDQLAETYRLEKIKTIGDCYMVAAGLPEPRPDHALVMAEMALAMRDVIQRFLTPAGQPFQLRIGINSGPVVAGVIGRKKFIYDLWGDAVNVASRMESHGIPGKIQVSLSTAKHLQGQYQLEPRGEIDVKGKGPMQTFFLIGHKSDQASSSVNRH